MASIDQFKAQLQGGGARANQFRVTVTTPAVATGLEGQFEKTSFMIKAAQLPGQTITEIPVNFRGRQLYIAGDRTFETWNTTIINDTDFFVRNGMESWMNGINNLDDNQGVDNMALYVADLFVDQLGRDGKILKSYTLKNCWPTVIAPIDLNYDTVSEIETFDVTWRYTSFSASNLAN
jgi:hypothetical protein